MTTGLQSNLWLLPRLGWFLLDSQSENRPLGTMRDSNFVGLAQRINGCLERVTYTSNKLPSSLHKLLQRKEEGEDWSAIFWCLVMCAFARTLVQRQKERERTKRPKEREMYLWINLSLWTQSSLWSTSLQWLSTQGGTVLLCNWVNTTRQRDDMQNSNVSKPEEFSEVSRWEVLEKFSEPFPSAVSCLNPSPPSTSPLCKLDSL